MGISSRRNDGKDGSKKRNKRTVELTEFKDGIFQSTSFEANNRSSFNAIRKGNKRGETIADNDPMIIIITTIMRSKYH